MSTVRGDGEFESTQVLSEGDLQEVDRGREDTGVVSTEQSVETTKVMEDSQLRELVGDDGAAPTPVEAAAEAEHRRRRDAERAAREREAAMARVRSHRRQAANTRALRPAGAPPPSDAKVSLSRDALNMLDREIERSDPPPPEAPATRRPAPPPPVQAAVTNRPPRGTVPIRKQPQVPPPAKTPEVHVSPQRAQQLLDALDEIELRLRAGDVQGALAAITRAKG